MSQNLERLKGLLAEMFQLDQAELDFGIYRIMNTKREEIVRFLDRDLLPQVCEAFQAYEAENRGAVETELAQAIEKAKELGADPETLPRVKELRAKLTQAVDVTALENEVYSHLYSFFRRYYQGGDFISLRRYKEGVYAIPYEGEEVKLHWANHDQYYIKTSEYLRDYAFKLPSGRRVHFKLAQADTDKDNNRAPNGNDRRFMLSEEQPLAEEKGEFVIRFDYRPHPDRAKQADLNSAAVDRVLNQTKGFDDWRHELALLRPTEKNPNRTLLEKHLTEYTARNTFDYFIHKDLGTFLRRELDFYIKNEVIHLDDIESDTAPRVEQYLSKIKAIRRIAHKLIDFLAQIENFQKKLWLKTKFVVETQYCITVDRIFALADEKARDWLLEQIMKNDAQREEWVSLCAIDEIKGDLTTPGYSNPLKPEFLKCHATLLLDTRHFDQNFKQRLLANFDDLDTVTDGLLIHGENFQALSLLQSRFQKQVTCIYLDPPYNTDASPIIYKNDYRRSSWLALLANRLELDARLRLRPSLRCIAIDDFEYPDLLGLLEQLSDGVHHATVAVRSKPQGRPTATGFSSNHEYAVFWGASDAEIGRLPRTGSKAERYPLSDERGVYSWGNMRKSGTDSDRVDRPRSYYPLYVRGTRVRIPAMKWREIDETWEILEKPDAEETEVYPIDPSRKQKVWTCSPERAQEDISDIKVERDDNGKIEIYKKYRPNQEGALPGTWWDDPTYSASESGTKVIKELFGTKIFDYPKSINLVVDSLRVCRTGSSGADTVLDYFGGSGTTGHAVIKLNREDGARRKFILVEVEHYFDTVLLPRIKKVVFAPEWKDGKPTGLPTKDEAERGPRVLKYIRLESYDDTLNNLALKRTGPQQTLLEEHAAFREDYILRYMLDVEARESPSLLNVEHFEDPFNYKLNIATGTAGETKPTVVDLVETFNYLIGLRVQTTDDVRGVRVVTGMNPQGERVLILWRKTKELDNDALDAWFCKQGYNTKDQEYDIIYVNGDSNLENLRKADQTWKVRLIEEEFRRLMFDVQDV